MSNIRIATGAGDFRCYQHGTVNCWCLTAAAAPFLNVPIDNDTKTLGTFVTPDHLCPDLLRYEQIGPADDLRGRAVRAFFWLMRAWPTKGGRR